MQDEREYLMRHTFPVLREWAAKRDVTLTELDLRWGITPEEAESGKVVEICLREIENSIPFFVGIIGNRYGWVPSRDDIDKKVTDRFASVENYLNSHLSVTEMEMQFGVLDREEDMHAYFYIKEQQEEQDNPEMLNRLRKAVRASRYPDSTYASPEDLGNQVENAFRALLDEVFPEEETSEAEREARQQRAFRNSLCRNYIRDEHNFQVLNEWLENKDSPQLVVTGASGLGKSALIANWIKDQEERPDHSYQIVYHFVGNGGNEGSHGAISAAIAGEIRQAYGFVKENNEGAEKKDELEDAFLKVASDGDRPLLVVLDAVNQVADVDNAKQLNWLPIPPRKVRILFSTLEDDVTMEVFRNRHYPVFTLQPLSLDRRRELVKTYLGDFGKHLSEAQIQRIITDSQCENTLVLKTLLDELLNFGIFERLDERIDFFLHTESVEEFYQTLLGCYEDEFPFTQHVLSLLALSRSGLSEGEILQATNITQLHWSQFYCSFRSHLTAKIGLVTFGHAYVRSAVESRYNLLGEGAGNKVLREEIISLFKDHPSTPRALHELPHQYYALGDDVRLHEVLMDIDAFLYLCDHDDSALIRYWNYLKDNYNIEDYLPLAEKSVDPYCSYRTLTAFCRAGIVNPHLAWECASRLLDHVKSDNERAEALNFLGLALESQCRYQESLDSLLESLRIRLTVQEEDYCGTAQAYSNVGYVYFLLGNNEKALEYQQKGLEIIQLAHDGASDEVAKYYNNIGLTYRAIGDFQKALDYCQQAYNQSKSVYGDAYPNTALFCNNLGLVNFDVGNTSMALECFQKALAGYQNVFGNSHPSIAQTLNNIGNYYCLLGEYNTGLDLRLKVLAISLAVYGEQNDDTATYYDNIGCNYDELGQYDKALKYKKKALKIRRFLLGDNHYIVGQSYNNIGYSYGLLGNPRKELSCCKKALKVFLSSLGEQHPSTATTFDNIGMIYAELGNYSKAIEYQQKSLEIRQSIYDKPHSDIANSYNNIGYTYGLVGDALKELEYYQKALLIRQRLFGDNHPDVATSFNNIGLSYGELGDYTKALEYQQKALEIRLSIFDEHHPDVAGSYNNIGSIYGHLGDYQKQLDYELKALEIRRTIFGDAHPETATCYNNVGTTYADLNDYPKALEYQLKALEIRQAIYGDDHPDTASSFNCVGNTYGNMDDYSTSLKYLLKALEIHRTFFGDDSPTTAITYNSIGNTYGLMGEHEKALEYKLEALKIQQSISADHPNTATYLNNVGWTYKELGDLQHALECQLKALEIRRTALGDEHPNTADSYGCVGLTYYEMGDTGKAIEFQKKAFELCLSIYGEGHPETATYCSNLGWLLNEMSDYGQSLEYYQKSIQICLSTYGENHSETARIFNNTGFCYLRLERYEDAIRCVKKALDISLTIDDIMSVATYNNRLGYIYQIGGDDNYACAIAHYRQAAELFAQLGNDEEAEENRQAAEALGSKNQ